MLWAEWWGWELNLFAAGYLCTSMVDNVLVNDSLQREIADTTAGPNQTASCVPLDVFPVLSQTMVICFMFHYGFSIQGGAHVGNLLGANLASRAKTAILASIPPSNNGL